MTRAISIVAANGGEPRPVATTGDALAEWSPDGRWILFLKDTTLYRVAKEGGQPSLLSSAIQQAYGARFFRDGRSIYFHVIDERTSQLWKLSLSDGKISRLTQLEGRRGRLGYIGAADDRYIYFTWYEDEGDIWVMDVAQEES
jgi:Tol biopolymer transport system component